MSNATISTYSKSFEMKGKTYIYHHILVALDKAEYDITISAGGSIDVMKTRNGKKHCTQVMPKTFWSWEAIESNYKLLAPHMLEIKRNALELVNQ